MVNEQLLDYVRDGLEKGLDPKDFANFNTYCDRIKAKQEGTPRA